MNVKLRFSADAVRDIDSVLAATFAAFGQLKYDEYKVLIREALAAIAVDPDQFPARHRPEIHADARTFHIARRGKRARHFFLYRVAAPGFVDIARLLHDSMDLREHLPAGFESSGQ